ncbi:hypothetical protein EV426DRAFT_582678 [Tirmania nivea]|nr:hypothetical protein EV426DRAFT_582678 [Tirmania nivea]
MFCPLFVAGDFLLSYFWLWVACLSFAIYISRFLALLLFWVSFGAVIAVNKCLGVGGVALLLSPLLFDFLGWMLVD